MCNSKSKLIEQSAKVRVEKWFQLHTLYALFLLSSVRSPQFAVRFFWADSFKRPGYQLIMAVEVVEAGRQSRKNLTWIFAVFFDIWPSGGKCCDVSDFDVQSINIWYCFARSAPRNRHKHETLQDEEGKLIARPFCTKMIIQFRRVNLTLSVAEFAYRAFPLCLNPAKDALFIDRSANSGWPIIRSDGLSYFFFFTPYILL